MSVISDVLTAYRAALVAAGFTDVPSGVEPEDTTGSVHRKFRLTLAGDDTEEELHGGAAIAEYTELLRLEQWWDPENAESTVWNTAGDDRTTSKRVMRKASNRPAGCRLVSMAGGWTIDEEHKKSIKSEGFFRVRYRETQDLG